MGEFVYYLSQPRKNDIINEVIHVSIVRHTKNHEATVEFYRDRFRMAIEQAWDYPD